MDTASISSEPADLPDPKRVITNTQADGKSVFVSAIDENLSIESNRNGTLFRLAYTTGTPPVNLTNEGDLEVYSKDLENPPRLVRPGGGAVVWYVDHPPGAASPLHRTISLDFVVQLEGELELSLDSGETRLMKRGDLTVQRATIHAWHHPSMTVWSRMLTIVSEVEPVVVGKQTLNPFLPADIVRAHK